MIVRVERGHGSYTFSAVSGWKAFTYFVWDDDDIVREDRSVASPLYSGTRLPRWKDGACYVGLCWSWSLTAVDYEMVDCGRNSYTDDKHSRTMFMENNQRE